MIPFVPIIFLCVAIFGATVVPDIDLTRFVKAEDIVWLIESAKATVLTLPPTPVVVANSSETSYLQALRLPEEDLPTSQTSQPRRIAWTCILSIGLHAAVVLLYRIVRKIQAFWRKRFRSPTTVSAMNENVLASVGEDAVMPMGEAQDVQV